MGMPTTRENLKERNSYMLAIDAKKLDELLAPYFKAKKLDYSKLSTKYGYGSSYFSNVRKNGVISPQAMILLKNDFGIEYDDYKWVEPASEVKVKDKAEDKPEMEQKVALNIDEVVKVLKQCLFDLDFMANEIKNIKNTVDDLKAQSELNGETLNDIKQRTKPYATSK